MRAIDELLVEVGEDGHNLASLRVVEEGDERGKPRTPKSAASACYSGSAWAAGV